MNSPEDISQEKTLFIEVQPVKWQDISAEERSDLDFIPDILTDTEVQCINVLTSSGAISARELWNRISENIYKSENGLDDVDADYDELQDILKEEDIDHPSYHTVKNSLSTLVENGVVTTRPSNKGNTDKLYTINPRFKKVWRNRRREIRSNNEWMSLSDRAVDFYMIDKSKETKGMAYSY